MRCLPARRSRGAAMNIRLGRRLLHALMLCLSACAVSGTSDDPFSGSATQRPTGRPYRVRLDVVCGGCSINYSIAARATSIVSTSPVWRATFDRYPRFPEAIRLTATGEVEAVRIYVNGALVASQERRPAATYVTLSVETVVPPPATTPQDTLEIEGEPPLL